MKRRRTAVIVAAAVALVAAAAIVIITQTGRTPRSCGRSSLLVPSCGPLWGIATDPNTQAAVDSVERRAGGRFDLVYRFHDLNDTFPTADERALVAAGRVLHLTVSPTIFGSSQVVTWRQISAGKFDRQLLTQARGVAALRVPVFVSFDHETDRTDRSARGSPADFRAAWRHVHDLYARAGARNAVWVWVVTGYRPFFKRAGQMWPGNNYVDWISWEAYNGSGCTNGAVRTSAYRSFESVALEFYRWVHRHGPAYGIDVGKPMMISEAGSVVYPTAQQRTADWYAGIPSVLARYRQIRAVTIWDRPGNGACHYRFDQSPAVLASVGQTGIALHYPPLLS